MASLGYLINKLSTATQEVYRTIHEYVGNKVLESIPYGFAFGAILAIIEKYLFADWKFLISLFIIVTLDTCLGIYISIIEKKFSSRGFSPLLKKTAVYITLCILSHQLIHLDFSYANWLLSTLRYGVYMSMIVRETLSIFENAGKLGYGIPKRYRKYLEDFSNDTGEYGKDRPKEQSEISDKTGK